MFSSLLHAQVGYQVKFHIDGLKDTSCLIARYYGNSSYIQDTLRVDNRGRCTFKPPPDLPRGMYSFVISEDNYFDFILNNDHRFSIETTKVQPLDHMTITGSPENMLFLEYLQENRRQNTLYQSIQERMKQYKDVRDTMKTLYIELDTLNRRMISYKRKIAESYPQSFLALMIRTMQEPDIPEIHLPPDGRKDTTFAYRYYKSHFWDGTDFTDDRSLHTPVLHTKLIKYFDKVLDQQPDTIIRYAILMIEKARPSQEMFKYILWFTTSHYERSEIMGMDKVFVYLVDTYYATGQTPWVDKNVLANILNRVAKIRPLLIGQIAPNMIMQDTNLNLVSMHDIKARYLILLFWDPDCGHCEQELPVLKTFYDTNHVKYDMKVFAVCSDTSMVKWKKAIKKKDMNFINVDGPRTLTGNYHDQYDISTTPVIFILNNRKEIIAKHLQTDQVARFIRNHAQLTRQP
jgi:peroxiredoxin